MSFLIRVEDRQEFGQGHRSRAIAILQAFVREGKEAYIMTNNFGWIELLEMQHLPAVFLKSVGEATAELNEILEISAKLNSAGIILDGERFDEAYCHVLMSKNLPVILLNDLPRNVIESATCIVNPNIYATKDLYPNPWPQKFYGGPDFVLLRQSFLKPRVPRKSDAGVLITLGVSGNADLIASLQQLLQSMGLRCDIAEKLNEEQMVNAIDDALFVICGASVTLHEVWARSRFAIPIYQARDQQYFWKYLTSLNVQVVEGLGQSEISITNSVKKIMDNMDEGLRILDIDNRGAQRLVNEIYKN